MRMTPRLGKSSYVDQLLEEVPALRNADGSICASNPFWWDFLDIKMRGTDGIELQKRMREVDPQLITVMMTGYASVDTAVIAMKNGAYDYLTKPLDPDEVSHKVSKALEAKFAKQENERLKSLTNRNLRFRPKSAFISVDRRPIKF